MRAVIWIVGLLFVVASGYEAFDSRSITAIATFLGAVFALLTADRLYVRKSASSHKVETHDLELFDALQRALPFDPTIRTLRDQDFATDYRSEWLAPLNTFVATWDNPNFEFIDNKLEAEKQLLFQSANALAQDLARETVPNDHNEGWRTVYPWNQRGLGERPEHVRHSARILNQSARDFVPIYEAFVRTARDRLKAQA